MSFLVASPLPTQKCHNLEVHYVVTLSIDHAEQWRWGVRRAKEVHVPSQQPPHVPPIFSGYAASWLDAIAQDAKWLTVATGP